MGLLARKDQDDEKGGDSLALNLDDLACPSCGRDLPPWVTRCPDDGTLAVPREHTQAAGLPDIPAHLLDGLDGQDDLDSQDDDPA